MVSILWPRADSDPGSPHGVSILGARRLSRPM